MRNTISFYLLQAALLFLLTSCVTTRQTNYMQPTKDFVQAYKDTVPYKDYRLKTGDRLYIQVYSIDEKTNVLFNGARNTSQMMVGNTGTNDNLDLYTYTIQLNGCIRMPVVGEINIEGKTLREAKETIEDIITPTVTNDTNPEIPVCSVDLRMLGRYFNIIGAGKSGRFAFPREKVNIYQAIAMSGDFGFYANKSKIKVIRETSHGTEIKVFDARSVDIMHSEFYYLEPNDVIILEPLNQKFFGVTTFWTALSTVVATYSFGVIIYKSFFNN